MPNTKTPSPPTLRRCRRILEAHHLRSQGLSIRQIARQMGCAPSTPTSAREIYANRSNNQNDNLDDPGLIETEQEQSFQFPEESGPIQTNLDKSEHLQDEFPVQDKKFVPIPPNSPPKRPPETAGPQYPDSWDSPTSYIPPQNPNNPMVRRLFESSKWK